MRFYINGTPATRGDVARHLLETSMRRGEEGSDALSFLQRGMSHAHGEDARDSLIEYGVEIIFDRRAARVCRCCGEPVAPGAGDCCSDDFHEPGDLREWA